MNTDERYEEREMVEHAVAALELRHTAIDLETDGFLDKLRVLVRQHDAPVYTITYYVQWQLMQRIAEHGYRISISGTGATSCSAAITTITTPICTTFTTMSLCTTRRSDIGASMSRRSCGTPTCRMPGFL